MSTTLCDACLSALTEAIDGAAVPAPDCTRCDLDAARWSTLVRAGRVNARLLGSLARPECPDRVFERTLDAINEQSPAAQLLGRLGPVAAPTGSVREIIDTELARAEKRVGSLLETSLASVELPESPPALGGLPELRRSLETTIRELPQRPTPGWVWSRVRADIGTVRRRARRTRRLAWTLAAVLLVSLALFALRERPIESTDPGSVAIQFVPVSAPIGPTPNVLRGLPGDD